MPTPDRTTIKAAFDEFVSKLRTNLVADPPTAAKPFRRVVGGAVGVEAFARPFASVWINKARVIGVTDNDKIVEVNASLQVVAESTDADPSTSVLDAMGAVDDYLDGIIDTGVLDGADGFDDRAWSLSYPKTTTGARVITATAAQAFVVRVERGQNRVPAA